MLPSSYHPNLTPMGTVPISVIYGFEYPLNGSESRTKTRGESLHTSGENKKINPLPSVASVRKTKGCLSNLQRPQKRTATGINQQYFPLKMCINIPRLTYGINDILLRHYCIPDFTRCRASAWWRGECEEEPRLCDRYQEVSETQFY